MCKIRNKSVKNPISEARRYVANAQEVLSERGKLNTETGRYEDSKYVKAAGHYLWTGALIALEAVFHVEEEKKKLKGKEKSVSIDDYTAAVSQRDNKLLGWVTDGYQIMHLYMGYDGIQDKRVCVQGVLLANNIIDKCEVMMA